LKILAISGSLREASLNTALLRALARIAPAGIEVQLFDGLAALPLFNPDHEADPPAPVAALQAEINAADALVFASPEYAHGVTGALKNALDWMVGNGSFMQKPVAVFNASPRALHADASLREILATMAAQVIEDASITVALIGSGLAGHDIDEHPDWKPALLASLQSLQAAVSASTPPP
jgi:chromate reductase